MKKTIIASIVLASLSSASAFAVTDIQLSGNYENDKSNLQYTVNQTAHTADAANAVANNALNETGKNQLKITELQGKIGKIDGMGLKVDEAVKAAGDATEAVKTLGKDVTNNTTAIEKLQLDSEVYDASILSNTNEINKNKDAIAGHDIAISDLASKAGDNARRLDTVEGIADENTVNIGKNSESIENLKDSAEQNAKAASVANDNALAAADMAIDNGNNIEANKKNIATNAAGVAANKAGVETNAKNIETNKKVAKDYTDQVATQTLDSAYSYTNSAVGAEAVERANGDARTLQSANNYTNQKFAQLDKRIGKVRKEANAGTASALAASQVPQVETNGRFSLGAGLGGYGSQTAVAVGFSARVNERVVTKFTVTTDTQHNFGYGAGVAVSW